MDCRIELSQLQPGDLLLSMGKDSTAVAVRSLTGGLYSHCSIWTGRSVIESTAPRVMERSLAQSLQHHPRLYVDVYRYRHAIAGDEVVAAARRYVDRPYSYGDLFLGAAVLATCARFPHRKAQVRALRAACVLYRVFGLDRELASKRVTCGELVARAYAESGLSLQVRPAAGQTLDLAAVYGGLLALGHEILHDRRTFGAQQVQQREAPFASHGTSQADGSGRLRGRFVFREAARVSTGVAAMMRGRRVDGAAKSARILAEGWPWVANLMAPRYLETSPDFIFRGRLHDTGQTRSLSLSP
jgi:hypothetical protein